MLTLPKVALKYVNFGLVFKRANHSVNIYHEVHTNMLEAFMLVKRLSAHHKA